MGNPSGWSNKSVLAFADGGDPLECASAAARQLLESAAAQGLVGPLRDPLALARLLGVGVTARNDVADASIAQDRDAVSDRSDAPLRGLVPNSVPLSITYNPNRPKGRLRFSIAHEIAHALFPDAGGTVRHRAVADVTGSVPDGGDWELELLCNVVAAELLPPPEAIDGLLDIDTDIDFFMEARRRWDVSPEALLRRLVSASRRPLILVSASRITGRDPSPLKVEYVLGPASILADDAGRMPEIPVQRGQMLGRDSPFATCMAVGQTVRGAVTAYGRGWPTQAVGVSGYRGQLFPRVLGLVELGAGRTNPHIQHVQSELLDFGGDTGPVIVAHVVSDIALGWDRCGVAGKLAARYPQAAQAFRAWSIADAENRRLGSIHAVDQSDGDRTVTVVSVVAKQGFGPGAETRLRYDALSQGLAGVADLARGAGARVHFPHIGVAQPGGRWDLIENDLAAVFADSGINVTVHTLPVSGRH